MYKQDLEKSQQELAKQKEQTRLQEVFLQFFSGHRELRACEAAQNVLRDYFDDTTEIDRESLEFAYGQRELKEKLKACLQTEPQERHRLIASILSLQKTRMSAESYLGFADNYRKAQYHKSTQQLRDELAQLEGRQDLSKKSVPELRAVVRTENGLPILPDRWTRFQLETLAETSTGRQTFKQLVLKYGSKQLNERLAQPYEQ